MRTATVDSVWHGPLRLPGGVRPMVDRCDTGRVLVQIEYDPAITEDDLAEAEDCVMVFIENRRRRRAAEGRVTTAHPLAVPSAVQEIGA